MSDSATTQHAAERRDRTHYLYVAVIVAVVLGIFVGILFPSVGVALRPIGTAFVNLVKMMISPIIFCTIVLGIGSIRQAAKVGKVGGLALLYFIVMSTFALVIGLIVGNLLEPGAGMNLAAIRGNAPTAEAESTTEFLLGIIPTTLVSPLTSESVLQTLFVALLVGFVLRGRLLGAGQLLAREARVAFSAPLADSAASATFSAAFTVCVETCCAVRVACSVTASVAWAPAARIVCASWRWAASTFSATSKAWSTLLSTKARRSGSLSGPPAKEPAALCTASAQVRTAVATAS